MPLAVLSQHIRPTPQGLIDSEHPDGSVPPEWDLTLFPFTSLIERTAGVVFSIGMDQYLDDVSSPRGTFSVVHVSGDNAASEGWSIVSRALTKAGGGGTGAGAFLVRYTSGAVTIDTPTIAWSDVSLATGIRWTPGHYFSQQSINTFTVSHLNEADAAGCVGAWLRVTWSAMEPTKNNYTWSVVDTARDQCLARGMKLLVILMTKFNSSVLANTLPAYLSSEPNSLGGYYQYDVGGGVLGWNARMDASGVIDRLLLLSQEFADRYQDDTTIEGLCVAFDSVMPNPRPGNFTAANHYAQRLRLIQTLPTYFTKMNVWTGLDYLSASPSTDILTLVAAMKQYKCGIGGIDGVTGNPDHSSDGMRAFRGLIPSGPDWVTGGIDYRGTVPCMAHISTAAHSCGLNPQQIRDVAVVQHGSTHVGWIRKVADAGTYAGTEAYWRNSLAPTGALKFPQDVETFLTNGGAGTGVNIGCPTQYGGACNL